MGIIAILSSPSSFTLNDEMEKIRTVISDGSGIFHYEVEKHKDIAEALGRFQQADVDCIVILGDRALTSATFETIIEKNLDKVADIPLAILPAGDNNIVAESLGAIYSEPHKALKDILQRHQKGTLTDHISDCPLIKLEGVRGVGYLYGLFFCAGEMIKQKNIFKRKVAKKGLFSRLGKGITIIAMVQKAYRSAMGKNRLENAIRINRNQRGAVVGHFFMLLITTLEKTLFGVDLGPAVRRDTAHFISVENTADAVLNTGKQMFQGHYNKIGLPGHVMADIQHARIVLQTPFILDGSYYETEKSGELFITITNHLKFITLR